MCPSFLNHPLMLKVIILTGFLGNPDAQKLCVFSPWEQHYSFYKFLQGVHDPPKITIDNVWGFFLIYSLRLVFIYTVNNCFLTVIKALGIGMNQTWSSFYRSIHSVFTRSFDGPLGF